MFIENGTGNGNRAAVNGRNELVTYSITESESEFSSREGLGYDINTGEITSLTAGDATILYFKNDEDKAIVIERIHVGIRGFTGLSDAAVVSIIRAPTGGDLISDATAVTSNTNRNYGSSKTLKSTTLAYKGKAAGTVTGGSTASIFYIGDNEHGEYDAPIILERGSAIAVKVDSDATAGTVFGELHLHIEDSQR